MLSVITAPDNAFKAAMRRNAYMAASILARFTGDETQDALMKIADEYTELVASRTMQRPPFLTFQQIAMDPNFQETYKKANIKNTGDKVVSVGGLGLKDELIPGVPNTFFYSTVGGIAYFAWKWYKGRKGGSS